MAKKSALDLAIESIRKDFEDDEDVVILLSDYREKVSKMQFISTGSIDLDRALVRGGIPTGRIIEIYGPPGGGKSSLAMEILKQAQKMFPKKKTAYVDAEMTLDPSLPSSMGLDAKKFVLIQGFSGEDNLDSLERLIKSGDISIGVCDSVDALLPKDEDGKGMVDPAKMANLPQIMSRSCRRFAALCRKTNTTVIFINQTRSKVGSAANFGNPETTSGGNALPFYASQRIRVSGSGETKAHRIIDPYGNVIGHRIKFEIKKNKLGIPYRVGEVDLMYGKGFDYDAEIIRLSVDLGIADKSKNGIYTINSKDYKEPVTIKGIGAFREALISEEFRSMLLEQINKLIAYKPAQIDNIEEVEGVAAGDEGYDITKEDETPQPVE
jgi:recombination protein RecA